MRGTPSTPPRAGACLAVALAALAGCRNAEHRPPKVLLFDGHAEAFAVWSEHGARERVLVHVDAHDDFLREVPEAQLGRLRELVRSRRLDKVRERLATGESELMNEGNFIHAAGRLGQVREVYWVIAFGSRRGPGFEAADRRALREMGFPAELVRSFRSERGCLVGRLHGLPLTVCGMADLPRFGEPVLLDVDVDLFSILARQNAVPVEASVRAFAADLRHTRLRFDLATIARSVEDGYTALEHAWVAPVVRDLIAARGNDLPAAQWELLRARSRADLDHEAGDYAAAAASSARILAGAPDDVAAHYALARASLELGQVEAALRHAERAARADPVYELGLLSLGRRLSEQGRPEALQFFDRAEVLAPASEALDRVRGDYYFGLREYRSALKHYVRLSLDGDRELAVRMGDAYTALEHYEEGLMYYELGARIDARRRQSATSRPHPSREHGRARHQFR